MLEIAVDSLESAINAINGGADELEVCSFLCDGGLTPTIGLVGEVQEMIQERNQPKNCRTKVNVTIRCRAGDFLYDEEEMATMLHDIKRFKKLNVDGFVFGAVASHMEIDEAICIKVFNKANPKKLTFSCAFDQTREFKKSAAILKALDFDRVHTMGMCTSIDEPDAIMAISYLADRYSASEFSIVPCGGITTDNVASFINMGCPMVHATCRKVKQPVEQRDFYLGIGQDTYVVDEDEVRELRKRIDEAVMARDKNDEQA